MKPNSLWDRIKKYYAVFITILAVLFLYSCLVAYPNEHFFKSKHQPQYYIINLAAARIVVWYPWPFISVSFGWMLDDSPKVSALQIYFGIKCDGTRTKTTGGPPPYVMVLTPKELLAVRIRHIDRIPVWKNQGGA